MLPFSCKQCIQTVTLRLQIQNITDYAMKVMTDAGVEFVPFDSQALNDVSADAWGAGTESYAYEDTDTLARLRSCSPILPSPIPFPCPGSTHPPPLPLCPAYASTRFPRLPHTHPSCCTATQPPTTCTQSPTHPPTYHVHPPTNSPTLLPTHPVDWQHRL